MTATDAPPPPPPVPTFAGQAAPPAAPKAPVSVLAVVSFVLVILTSIGYLTAKTLVPVVDGPSFEKQVNGIANVFGVLGLLSFIPIAVGILLGHLGVHGKAAHKRGRALGIAGIAIGYLLLALYFNRLIVAAIAAVTFQHGANFLQNTFFWA